MTALAAARERLEVYVAECILKHDDLDVLKLRRLEDDLVMTARVSSTLVGGAPF